MKLETLKAELENKLQAETARASAWVWHYKYCKQNEKRLSKWIEYRTAMFHNMMLIKKMTMDDFRLALHRNQYGIQQAIFGQN